MIAANKTEFTIPSPFRFWLRNFLPAGRRCQRVPLQRVFRWIPARNFGPLLMGVLLVAMTPLAQAQWLTQSLSLTNGWNAVFLHVDASYDVLDQQIGEDTNNPIQEIWRWNPPSLSQLTDTPLDPTAGTEWTSWVRGGNNNALQRVSGNRAYLVRVSAGANGYTWNLMGQPVAPLTDWTVSGLNLIGFPTVPVAPPKFDAFLAQAPELQSAVPEIYWYKGGDLGLYNPALLPSPLFRLTPVKRGQAYWIRSGTVFNRYFGPFEVMLGGDTGVQFKDNLSTRTFRLKNLTTNTMSVTLRLVGSEAPPSGQSNIVSVPPLLVRGSINLSNLTYSHTELPAGGTLTYGLAARGLAGSEMEVVLGLNRYAITSNPGTLLAGILRFTDSLGYSQVDVPVSAVAGSRAGLWGGNASITQVGQYLKTYAVNENGSYQYAVVTNTTYTTNAAVLSATNLSVYSNFSSNTAADYFNVSNQVVNVYSSTNPVAITNAGVLGTNTTYTIGLTTNTVVTTTATNFYYSGSTLFWQYSASTNISSSASTNSLQTVVAYSLTGIASNNTPVRVTNLTVTATYQTNALTTNGIFLDPVTTLAVSGPVSSTNTFITTNLAYRVVSTNYNNFTVTSTTSGNATNYWVTNRTGSLTVVTNAYPTSQPVYVVTNGASWMVVYMITNQMAGVSTTITTLQTNTYQITNLFTVSGAVTNATGSTTNLATSNRGASITNGPNSALSTNITFSYYTQPTNVVTATVAYTTNSSYAVSGINTNLGDLPFPAPLRLLIHNPNSGGAVLLQQVYYGLDGDTNFVITPDESLLHPGYLGSARRMTAVHLPWSPTNKTWSFDGLLGPNQTRTATVTTAYDDQVSNPFLHTFHPDHDNLDATFKKALAPGAESYTLRRDIRLTVNAPGNDFSSLVSAGLTLNGVYAETVTVEGLGGASRIFRMAGTFSLNRLNDTPILTRAP